MVFAQKVVTPEMVLQMITITYAALQLQEIWRGEITVAHVWHYVFGEWWRNFVGAVK